MATKKKAKKAVRKAAKKPTPRPVKRAAAKARPAKVTRKAKPKPKPKVRATAKVAKKPAARAAKTAKPKALVRKATAQKPKARPTVAKPAMAKQPAIARAKPAPKPKAAPPARRNVAPPPPPTLQRERRRLPEAEAETDTETFDVATRDSRLMSSARTGHDDLRSEMRQHTEASPAMTAGDVDAKWQDAYALGDEAPGGDNMTPDQDRVDDIGKALGIEYADDEELLGGDELVERDEHRWELDPASKEEDEDL